MMDNKNCYLRLEKADTGEIILKYEEKVKKNASTYDGYTRVDKTEVFATNQLQTLGARILEVLSAQIEMPDDEDEKSEGKEVAIRVS